MDRPEGKFVADAMLGRLAKWLRIIGCDVAYFPDIADEDLIFLTLRENRILLTRDTLLIKRKELRDVAYFVHGDDYRDQFRQVVTHFSLPSELTLLTRCIECNLPLEKRTREDIKNSVPPFVYENVREFSQCPGCGRVYWPATHVERMKRELAELLK